MEYERSCKECGSSLEGYQSNAVFCGNTCTKRYARREKRKESRISSYLSDNPSMSKEDLEELFDEPARPSWRELVEEEIEPDAFHDILGLVEAVEQLRAHYEALVRPYRDQMRRNRGVKPRGLVELERERDQAIAKLERAYDHGDELARAKANEPQRVVRAHEHQNERAVLAALGNDLPGHRSGHVPYRGRETHDLWRWT